MFRLNIFVAFWALVYASCKDGSDNVVAIADVPGESLDIQISNGVGQTYNSEMQPTCHGKDAELYFPGNLKLVSGSLKVLAAHNLKADGTINLTVKKNSILIGTVCSNGKSKNVALKDSDCHGSVDSLLGDSLTGLLSTPGTYDLSQLESMYNVSSIIPLGKLPSGAGTIIDGEWQVVANIVSGGKKVFDLQIPSNKPWIYLSN